jgi:hypothetical protein
MKNNDQYLLGEAYSKIYESIDGGIESPDAPNNLIEDLKTALKNGANFVSFMYKSKGTGDTSIFNVNLNVDYQRSKSEDLEKIRAYEPTDELEQEAKDSILNPKERNVIKGDPYENLGKGIKLNKTNNTIHIIGWVENKEVMARGEMERKEVKSRPLTIAKNNLMKKLQLKSMGPTRKIRNFILEPENISGLKIKGNLIEFQD